MKKFASILLSMLMATGAIAAASAETYTGTAQGIGEVSVTLTVEDGKITAAEVVGEGETKGIGYEPCADGTFADAIVAAQGVDFDSISGATVTTSQISRTAGGKPLVKIWSFIYSKISFCLGVIFPSDILFPPNLL